MAMSEIPLEYKDFKDIFIEKVGSAALPEYQLWDYKIPLLVENLKYYTRLIPLLKKQEDFLKEYLDTHLEKQFIQKSTLLIAHSVLFAPKKDSSL